MYTSEKLERLKSSVEAIEFNPIEFNLSHNRFNRAVEFNRFQPPFQPRLNSIDSG